jgi:hypothetical protein
MNTGTLITRLMHIAQAKHGLSRAGQFTYIIGLLAGMLIDAMHNDSYTHQAVVKRLEELEK